MMTRDFAALLLVLFLGVAVSADDMPDAMAPIKVTIAVPLHHGHHALTESDHFHVLITNVSEKPVRLWTDRFSWGYDSLSFERIGDDDAVTRIAKRPRDWGKNYPDFLELAPGGSYVLNVDWFSDAGREIWENAPTRADGGGKPKLIKLRAVYETGPDGESRKLDVWTGKVTSAEGTYAIW